jgi:hypothetical protein
MLATPKLSSGSGTLFMILTPWRQTRIMLGYHILYKAAIGCERLAEYLPGTALDRK